MVVTLKCWFLDRLRSLKMVGPTIPVA